VKDDRQGTFRHRLSNFDPKYVSLEASAYGRLQLPLVEPDLTAPILQYGVTCYGSVTSLVKNDEK
jgi:hypothetical protein